METKEIKDLLIKELEPLSYELRTKISSEQDIPDELIDELLRKASRRFKIARLLIISIGIILIAILSYDIYIKDKLDIFLFFCEFLVLIMIQIVFNKDYKDNSKRILVFKLLKKSK